MLPIQKYHIGQTIIFNEHELQIWNHNGLAHASSLPPKELNTQKSSSGLDIGKLWSIAMSFSQVQSPHQTPLTWSPATTGLNHKQQWTPPINSFETMEG
jgi:hypothetical protein